MMMFFCDEKPSSSPPRVANFILRFPAPQLIPRPLPQRTNDRAVRRKFDLQVGIVYACFRSLMSCARLPAAFCMARIIGTEV